jgi:hypothetical protein
MKSIPLLAVAFIPILFGGCASRGPRVEIGGYTFSYDGKEYRIESVTPNYSEGYNILSRREGDRLVFKGIDKEQDGKLDELQVGNMPLGEARKIYEERILEGERRGYLKKRTFAREYKTSDAMYDYTLATYILVTGELYNRLTIATRQVFQEPAVLFDEDADGQLDRIEKGLDLLPRYQSLYREVLDRGVREGRVVKSDKKFLVTLKE